MEDSGCRPPQGELDGHDGVGGAPAGSKVPAGCREDAIARHAPAGVVNPRTGKVTPRAGTWRQSARGQRRYLVQTQIAVPAKVQLELRRLPAGLQPCNSMAVFSGGPSFAMGLQAPGPGPR